MNSKVFLYARVSSKDQNEERQIRALEDYCRSKKINYNDRDIFIDKISGKDFNRPQYQALKQCLRSGDVVIVKELDRLGRNKNQIKQELDFFKENDIRVKILNIPTTLIDLPKEQDWIFEMINNILIEVLAAIAEEERNKIRKRQAEGIEALKARNGGKGKGRPKIDITDNFRKEYDIWKRGEQTATETFSKLGLTKSTFYRLVREYGNIHNK